MFIETTLIVEGAIDETKILEDEDALTKYIDSLREEHGRVQAQTEWEVYVLRHDHAPDIECECVQYEQSHKPEVTLA